MIQKSIIINTFLDEVLDSSPIGMLPDAKFIVGIFRQALNDACLDISMDEVISGGKEMHEKYNDMISSKSWFLNKDYEVWAKALKVDPRLFRMFFDMFADNVQEKGRGQEVGEMKGYGKIADTFSDYVPSL